MMLFDQTKLLVKQYGFKQGKTRLLETLKVSQNIQKSINIQSE